MGLCYWKSALLLLSLFAFEKSAAALTFTNPSLGGLAAGASVNLTWSGASGTTTLMLQNGSANNLETVDVVASGIAESSLLWSPSAFTPTGTYVLRLEDTSGQSTISPEFTILPAGPETSLNTGLQFTNATFESITPNTPINITWSGATGRTTLTLQNGTEGDINDVYTLATGIQSSYLVWTPSATVQPDEYVFRLRDDSSGEIVYSNVFKLLAPGETAVDPNIPAAVSPKPEWRPNRPAPSHPNISPAAKIGVAVGSVVLTLLVIGIVIFYRRRHKDPVGIGSTNGSSDRFLYEGGKPPPPEMGIFEPRQPEPVELGRGRKERRSQERWR